MSKIGDALAGAKIPALGVDDGEEPDMEEGEEAPGKGELSAAKIMMRAKSPDEFARALRDFIELCTGAEY